MAMLFARVIANGDYKIVYENIDYCLMQNPPVDTSYMHPMRTAFHGIMWVNLNSIETPDIIKNAQDPEKVFIEVFYDKAPNVIARRAKGEEEIKYGV